MPAASHENSNNAWSDLKETKVMIAFAMKMNMQMYQDAAAYVRPKGFTSLSRHVYTNRRVLCRKSNDFFRGHACNLFSNAVD